MFDDDDNYASRKFREAAELNEKLNIIESNMENPFLPNVKTDEVRVMLKIYSHHVPNLD